MKTTDRVLTSFPGAKYYYEITGISLYNVWMVSIWKALPGFTVRGKITIIILIQSLCTSVVLIQNKELTYFILYTKSCNLQE